MMSRDPLWDRMKMLESQNDKVLYKNLPIFARLDGRCFSKFTKWMKRPYDIDMSSAMIATMKDLVEYSWADRGYTQSDEITLMRYAPDHNSEVFRWGKASKMISDLAVRASVVFQNWRENVWMPHMALRRPQFDCRVWNVPDEYEAFNVFYWRQKDASKNSVSMSARSFFSHKELDWMSWKDMQDKMFLEKWVNRNDYPFFFKRWTFCKKFQETRTFTQEEINKLPEKHQARSNPKLEYQRTSYELFDMWLKPTMNQWNLFTNKSIWSINDLSSLENCEGRVFSLEDALGTS